MKSVKHASTGIAAILQSELRCSEAIGIRKNEQSNDLNKIWRQVPNLYNTPPTIFQTSGNSLPVGQLSGLANSGIRTAFFATGDDLEYGHRAIVSPFVVYRQPANGRLIPMRGFFRLIARTPQQAVDFGIIAHRIAEESLCPGMVILDCDENTGDAPIELPDMDKIRLFVGMPDDEIESPTVAQKRIFGEKRKRIPDAFGIDQPFEIANLQNDILDITTRTLDDFAKLTGRSYDLIEELSADAADIIVIATGRNFNWLSKNLSNINKNAAGKVGVIHPTLISPFPGHHLTRLLKGKSKSIVVSSHISPDHDPLLAEIKIAFEKALENGRAGGSAKAVHAGYPVVSKLSDLPQLITFSVEREIDLKQFTQNLKNVEQGALEKLHFDLASVTPSKGKTNSEKEPKSEEGGAKTLPSKSDEEIVFKEEPDDSSAAGITSGDNFRQLISFFITGKTSNPELQKYIGANLKPVAFSVLQDKLDDDFPVCLTSNGSDNPVKSLDKIFDEINSEKSESDQRDNTVVNDLLLLKSRMASYANGKKMGRLSDLWDMAADGILSEIDKEEQKENLRDNFKKAKSKLIADGEVLSFSPKFPLKLLEESTNRVWKKKIAGFRKELNQTISQLSGIIGVDLSSGEDESEDFGESVAKAFKDELDFESFSNLVEESFEPQPLPEARSLRIQEVLKNLKSLYPLYSAGKDTGQIPVQFNCNASNCSEIIGQIQARIRIVTKFFRALHIAKLEIENKYAEDKHDQFFREFDINDLTAEDINLTPPTVVYVNSEDLDAVSFSSILELLETDLPVKVVLSINNIVEKSGLLSEQITWSTKYAAMSMALNNVYVFQSTVTNGEQLASGILNGLNYSGPALFGFYSGNEDMSSVPLQLKSVAAMASRGFPAILFDPRNGPDWGSRLSINFNPEFENDWFVGILNYQDAKGNDTSVDLAFTLVDFLAADSRFEPHFLQVPRSRWHENMILLQDYMKLTPEEARYKLPFIWCSSDDGTLSRVIPAGYVVGLALSALSVWRGFRELGLYKQEITRLEKESKAGIEDAEAKSKVEQGKSEKELKVEVISNLLTRLLSGDITSPVDIPATATEAEKPQTEKAPETEKPGGAAAAEEADTAEIVEPYIDTPLCTSCNECTNLNSRMFAYNENKQAYIKDASAGTFKELVKAAEKCPARIIHPGKPKNPNEPGLDKLIKRAAPFN